MENVLFSQSFKFYIYNFQNFHTSDNSAGTSVYFVGHLLSGRAHIETLDGDVKDFFEGDYFFIPQNLKYHSYWYGNPEIRFESFGFSILPDNRKFNLQKIENIGEVYDEFAKVKIKSCDCENIGMFYSALGKALKNMSFSYENGREAAVIRAVEYMRKNDGFKIADVARHVNVSESGLYALFRDIKNKTPIEIKWQLQIEKARVLLQTTSLSVEDVSELCGFSSPAYFRKILKRVSGKTPRELRKSESP